MAALSSPFPARQGQNLPAINHPVLIARGGLSSCTTAVTTERRKLNHDGNDCVPVDCVLRNWNQHALGPATAPSVGTMGTAAPLPSKATPAVVDAKFQYSTPIVKGRRENLVSIPSRPELVLSVVEGRSEGRIEGCGKCDEPAPFDTRSPAFRATQDASLPGIYTSISEQMFDVGK